MDDATHTRTVLLAVLVFAAACNGTAPAERVVADAKPSTIAAPPSSATPPVAKRTETEVVADDYETLLLAVQTCPPPSADDYGDCPTLEPLRKQPDLESGEVEDPRTVLSRKHLRHASPAVRHEAARALTDLVERRSIYEPDLARGAYESLVAAVPVESEPRTLDDILGTVTSRTFGPNAALDDAMWSRIGDTDDDVRAKVAFYALERRVPLDRARIDRALEMVDRDPVESIRERACEMLGEHPDDDTAAALAVRITDAKSSADLSRNCFEGLVAMWSDEAGSYANQAAYAATLALLRAVPRDASRAYLGESEAVVRARSAESEPRTWYSRAEVLAAVAELVLDEKVDPVYRERAARAIRVSGDEPTQAKLRKVFARPKTKDDENIADALASRVE